MICFSTLQIGSLIEAIAHLVGARDRQRFSTLQIGSLIEAARYAGGGDARGGFQYPSNRVVDRSATALRAVTSAIQVSVPFKSGR